MLRSARRISGLNVCGVWHGAFLVFFFFQAEDGIRDLTVTGVQTCALPIWRQGPSGKHGGCRSRPAAAKLRRCDVGEVRSEERRVGKSVDLGGRRIIKKKKKKSLIEATCHHITKSIVCIIE